MMMLTSSLCIWSAGLSHSELPVGKTNIKNFSWICGMVHPNLTMNSSLDSWDIIPKYELNRF